MLLSPQQFHRGDAFLGRLCQPEGKVFLYFGDIPQAFFSHGLSDHICLPKSAFTYKQRLTPKLRMMEEYYNNGEMARILVRIRGECVKRWGARDREQRGTARGALPH